LPGTLDANLRLAILDGLIEEGILPFPDVATIVRECDDCTAEGGGCECGCDCGQACVCGSGFDREQECGCVCGCTRQDYRYHHGVAAQLLATPVTEGQRSALRNVVWEAGDNDIVFTIWTYWDGWGDEFDITSLEGIAVALPALESLSIGLCAVDDLTPLADCIHLQRLYLHGGGGVADLRPLAGLGSLRTLGLECYQNVRDLLPLAGLPLEHLTLDSIPDSDLAPLEDMVSLRTLKWRRTDSGTGTEPPILNTFDNARVVEVLKQRGVAVTVS